MMVIGKMIFIKKGLLYYENGNKNYEGYFNRCLNISLPGGKEISYYKNGDKCYEGEFKFGEREGKGISYYKNGNKLYKGDFKYDK